MALVDHLDRIRTGSDPLRRAGASSVVALPLNSVTRLRIMRALSAGSKAGTDVVVLQDLPDTARPEILTTIADTLSKAARDWESPVTVTWAEVSPENVGRFDVALLLGVLYHLRHPLLALERVRSVTKQFLMLRDPRRSYEHPANPQWRFIRART